MAKARDIPGLERATSFREAAAAAVEVRTEEVFSFADGVLDTGDIERVHDMRVATRRLRAAMEIFAPCFPKQSFKRALGEVKELADVLGARRDPDVHIAALRRLEEALPAADRPGIETLVAEFAERQGAGNAELAQALEQADRGGLRERLLALAAEARAA